jgi:Intracellular proteinase inhibitor
LQRLLKNAQMKKTAGALLLVTLCATIHAPGQSPSPPHSVFERILHPFGASKKPPKYNNPRLRGLLLELQVPTEPVRLSEVRQLPVKATLSNIGNSPVALDFPTSQRIDIQLLNAAGEVLNRWSDNRAFTEEIGNVLVNPHEQIVYDETIATRELQPGRVYTAEVFFPRYPELRVRQKFMTAP